MTDIRPGLKMLKLQLKNGMATTEQAIRTIDEMLKAQEPIAPVCFEHTCSRDKYECRDCGSSEVFKEWEYCPWCGKGLKWE